MNNVLGGQHPLVNNVWGGVPLGRDTVHYDKVTVTWLVPYLASVSNQDGSKMNSHLRPHNYIRFRETGRSYYFITAHKSKQHLKYLEFS